MGRPSATDATRNSVNLEFLTSNSPPISLVSPFVRVSRELGPVTLLPSVRQAVENLSDRVESPPLFHNELRLKKCILLKLRGLYCLLIGQCVMCGGRAWVWSLIHMITHKLYTPFVDTESGGADLLPPLSPVSSRSFMLIMVKSLFGHSISVPTAAFVPWNEQMSAHELKISYAVYRCSSGHPQSLF
jgi:hypothetical protein